MPTQADAPVLRDWVLLTDLGARLGWSKQRVHQVLVAKGRIRTLHRLGQRNFVLSADEAEELVRNGGRVEADTSSGDTSAQA